MRRTAAGRILVLAISMLVADNSCSAQKGGGGQTGGSQQSSSPQSNQASSTPAGITGGSSPIESTLFSYAALNADAGAISAGVSGKVGDGATIVITTPTDVSAFIQWRAVIGQGETLLSRLRDAQFELNGVGAPAVAPIAALCVPPAPAPAVVPGQLPKVGSPFISGPSDVQTAIQTIASITAINQTLAPSSGSMTDLPLINLVGDLLKEKSTVYVPSLLTPASLDDTDLGDGPLVNLLWDLEDERTKAYHLQDLASGLLADWQVAATNKGNSCTSAQAASAAALVSKWTPPSQALAAVLASVDGFESSLFSGQGQSQNAGPSGQNGNQSAQTATPGATPAPPLVGGSPSQSPSQTPSSQPTAAAGNTLQQILAVDLLYQQLPKNVPPDSKVPLKNVHFLEVHALESGGAVQTKSNLFLGSRLYLSGGAVATFTLFDHSGKVECGGVAYGYQGYVKLEEVADALAGSHLRWRLDSSCGRFISPVPAGVKRLK